MGLEVEKKVVILGVGNLLLHDEGVGIHVIQELIARYTFGKQVQLIDGGTLGIDLLPFIQEADHLIIIDAVDAGSRPGSIFRFTPCGLAPDTLPKLSLHQASLFEVLRLAEVLGYCPETVVIGIQPQEIAPWGLELTPVVQQKIPEIIKLVLDELDQLEVPWQEKRDGPGEGSD